MIYSFHVRACAIQSEKMIVFFLSFCSFHHESLFNFFADRQVPYSQPLCTTQAKWCTKSVDEKEKCDVIQTAGITTGVFPLIECMEPVANAVSCLKEVNEGRADFTTIDSNFGYIARQLVLFNVYFK